MDIDSFYKAMFPSGRVDKSQLTLEKIMQNVKAEEEKEKNSLNVDYSPLISGGELIFGEKSGRESNDNKTLEKPRQPSRKEKREAERFKEKLKQKEAKEAQKKEAKKKEVLLNLERVRQQTATEIRVQSFPPEVRERLEKIAFNSK